MLNVSLASLFQKAKLPPHCAKPLPIYKKNQKKFTLSHPPLHQSLLLTEWSSPKNQQPPTYP